jgi:N-acetylglucosaminylphosphatidylinositol deacetylase
MSKVVQISVLLALILISLLQPHTTPDFMEVPVEQSGRTLLLTAHPDDETFFFSPTLTALSRMQSLGELGNIFVVCLSTGNAKGLGNVRREEFSNALDIFRIGKEQRIILDHPYKFSH